MPHFKLLFPNDYVGAWDLGKGDKQVIIERIQMEELKAIGSAPKKKPVVFFKGAKKKFVMNKTNATIIAELYGTDTDKWIGKAITLYATECEAFGKKTECIRVRPSKPNGRPAKEPAPAQPDYDPSTGEVAPEDEPHNREPGEEG